MHRRIAVATAIVTTSVLLSRVLGFFREWAVAHQIGPGSVTDAYYAAFTLPDFLNYLVAGGSLSVTFIPVFAKYVAENREEEGWRVFSTVITVMGFVLTGLVLVGEVFAQHLVTLIAPGFGPAERARVVFLTRLMLPAQICFYEGSILSAVQYAKGQFIVPSLAPLVYNIGIIAGGMLLSSRIGITGFSVGVLAGAFAGNFLLQIYGASRAGARFSPNLNVKHPGFWLFLKLSVPIMLAVSLSFADDWIIRIFGSYLEAASITWLSYGKTLMRVPLGLVGQAIGVASFPILAQLYSEKKFDDLNRILNSTLKGTIFLLVPISALTIAENQPLVRLAFAHTRLRGYDLTATGIALALFSIGMFGWGAQYILARGFYATRDTITPAVVGTVMTGLNIPLYWVLVRHAQYRGLALASSIGIVLYTAVLFVLLNRRTKNREASNIGMFFLKVSAASIIAGGTCYALGNWVRQYIAWQRPFGALAMLVIVTAVGIPLLAVCFKIFRVAEFESYMKQALAAAARKLGRAPGSATEV
ncbi:MAG TPA: murein biosynthesis integral membrane protein MurJ [Candidatus Limnocylindrales bacterium]|nr:murein biosynthesis integral membrane protein MurJ [Candidatus Limnocylindrales bacterium]